MMQILVLREHTCLIPQGEFVDCPEAVLNVIRVSLFNLFKEMASRRNFHVGSGINWKGQVFSKKCNHTLTSRMTCVGNILKIHYETYLLEYKLDHNDIDGECCLLCHSGAEQAMGSIK